MFPQTEKVISELIGGAIAIVGIIALLFLIGLFFQIVTRLPKRRSGHIYKMEYPTEAPPETKQQAPTLREEYLAQLRAEYPEPKKQELTRSELFAKLRAIDWFQFEKLVARMYSNLGYNVERRGGANPDGGIDLGLLRIDGEKIGPIMKPSNS